MKIKKKNIKYFLENLNSNIKIDKEKIFLEILPKFYQIIEIKEFIINWSKEENKSIINMINLLNLLDRKNKDIYLNDLNKYIVNKSDFYIIKTFNNNMELLINLKKNNIFQINNNNDYYKKTNEIIKLIKEEIENNIILYEDFISLMAQKKEIIIKKLKLLEIVEYEKKYEELIIRKDNINSILDKLSKINDNLIIYHKNKNKKNIDNINKIIIEIKNGPIKKMDKIKSEIKNELKLEDKIGKIEKVKNLNIFKILYGFFNNLKDDDDKHFNEAYNKLEYLRIIYNEPEKLDVALSKYIQKNTKMNIIEILDELMKYFGLDNNIDKIIIEKLKILLKSEKYLEVVENIIYFIDTINNNNKDINNENKDKENINTAYILDEKNILNNLKNMKDYLSNIKEYKYDTIMKYLLYLQKLEIFDYQNNNENNSLMKFFKCLYNKKNAIIFLIKKDVDSAKMLGEKLPSNNITAEDIDNFIFCLKFFNKIGIFSKLNIEQLLNNIKENINEDKEIIHRFERYSKNYISIIELDLNFDVSQSSFHKIKKIMNYSKYNIKRDSEEFYYYETNNEEKKIKIEIEDLLEIKNDVFIKVYDDQEKIKNIINEYGEFVDKLNRIIKLSRIIRNKRCPVNLDIMIDIKENIIKFKINRREKYQIVEYDFIDNYLIKLIKEIDIKYNEFYKNENYKYIRYFHGQQFLKIIQHINEYYEIKLFKPFLEFCLNNSYEKEVNKIYIKESEDEITCYDIIIKNVFENISKYLESFFKNNGFSLDINDIKNKNPFQNFLINYNNYKGIYKYKIEEDSFEEEILNLFLKLTNNIPISQNVLKCNEETTDEEIFAFLHRAILCNFHSLFTIEINDSLSTHQNYYICSI